MRECAFWNKIHGCFEARGYNWDEFVLRSRSGTDVRRWLTTWLARSDNPARLHLADMTQAFVQAITATSGKPYILDSNKETARGLFLLKYLPDVRVIHLVRDPRSIQRSHYWRVIGGHGFRFMGRHWCVSRRTGPLWLLLAAISWTLGNTLCELAGRAFPGRVLRIRYEDLCNDPAGVVRRIGAVFGLPIEDVACKLERGETFAVGHNVGGNPIRHAREVRFNPKAEEARPPLSRWAEVATLLLCWPLMHRYGYLMDSWFPRSGLDGRKGWRRQGTAYEIPS
jgi:hypothetical protein